MRYELLNDSTAIKKVEWPEYKRTSISISSETKPYCCPVCNGAGTVSRPPWIAGDIQAWESTSTAVYECKACQGTGVLWR